MHLNPINDTPMKNNFSFNHWKDWCWKSETRYYKLSLCQNLFSDWIIIKKWGGLKTKIQGSKTLYCESSGEINNIFTETHKRRLSRGYVLIE